MVDTLEKTLNPFHLVICFLGYGVFRHNLNHPKICFSIFYILSVWSIYACAFYYIVTIFPPNRIFYGFLILFIVIINLFATMISIIINIRQHKKIFMCIKNLGLIDDTLEQLGTPKEYYKLRKSIKFILSLWFIMICITWIFDSLECTIRNQDTRSVIIATVLNYPFYVNTFMDIVFMFFLRYIGTRFDKINSYIEQLSKIENCGLRCTWKKRVVTHYYIRSAENHEHMLWTAIHLHLKLCQVASNINGYFGIQMTLQMISYFVFLTGAFYLEYYILLCLKQINWDIGGSKLTFFIRVNIWFGIFLTKFIALNYICESVSTKAEKTKNMIYELADLVYFVRIRKDICQFVLQMSLRPLKFNGINMFFFGYKFIRKFIAAIISVLIFMVQMDNSPLSRILIVEQIMEHVNDKNM